MSGKKGLRVLIGGGSGWIGRELGKTLSSAGHQVTIVSRTKRSGALTWDEVADPSVTLPETDAVVNLAGTNLMSQLLWTSAFQEVLVKSRVNTTKYLADAIQSKRFNGSAPKVFVLGTALSAYPLGIPGPTVDEDYTGGYPSNFMGQLVKKWEQAAELKKEGEKEAPATRLVKVRTGVVLGKDEGAMKSLLPPFKMGIAHVAGTGTQYFPWIHIEDIVGIFAHAVLNDKVTGVLNGTAPEAATALDVTKEISRRCGGSYVTLHTPAFVLQSMFGPERASLLLEGAKVVPKRTLESGYQYKHPSLPAAIDSIL